MKKFLLLAFVAFSAFVFSSNAHAAVGAEVRYWFTELDSEVKITDLNVIGTKIDFSDDLGLDDEDFVEGRLFYESGRHKLRYAFVSMSWDADKTITKSIVYGGQTYSASTMVETELDIDYHRLGYEYQFIKADNYDVGLIFEIKYFDIETSLKATAAGLDESESVSAPLPTVGISFSAAPSENVVVEAEITGITAGSDAYVYDAEVLLGYKPHPQVLLSGGYRTFTMHAEDDDDEVDFEVSGPFVMVRATF